MSCSSEAPGLPTPSPQDEALQRFLHRPARGCWNTAGSPPLVKDAPFVTWKGSSEPQSAYIIVSGGLCGAEHSDVPHLNLSSSKWSTDPAQKKAAQGRGICSSTGALGPTLSTSEPVNEARLPVHDTVVRNTGHTRARRTGASIEN